MMSELQEMVERVETKSEGVSPRDAASAAVGAALSEGLRRLLAEQNAAGRCEAEGVHAMRGAVRVLRCDLRAFRTLIDAGAVEGLAEELRWLSTTLGQVRDAHVLEARSRTDAEGFEGALSPLFATLDRRREAASETLRAALRGDRFRELVSHLTALAANPAPTEEAGEPCRDVLPRLAAESWRKLKKRGRNLDAGEPDEAFHEVRKRAKRARFVAEAIAPALGTSSRKAAKTVRPAGQGGARHPGSASRRRDRPCCRLANRLGTPA